MKKFVLFFKWYAAFSKRLFLKPSFICLVLLIPVVTLALSFGMSEESGLVTVAVSSKDSECPYFAEICGELKEESTAIRYLIFDTPDMAVEAISQGRASCAWIFEDDFENKLRKYASGSKFSELCEVVVVKETPLLKLSREKLYGIIYKHLSNELFVDFMKDKKIDIPDVSEDYYRNLVEEQQSMIKSDIIEFSFIDAPDKEIEKTGYLTTPLNGILAVLMLVGCLSSMMYSLQDEEASKYNMFPVNDRLMLHFAAVSAAAVLISVIVFLSKLLLGDVTAILTEMWHLFLYIISCVVFCILVGIISGVSKRMCVVFPITIIASLILCPIFIEVPDSMVIKFLLPSLYYIRMNVEPEFTAFMIVYILAVYLMCCVTYRLKFMLKYKR